MRGLRREGTSDASSIGGSAACGAQAQRLMGSVKVACKGIVRLLDVLLGAGYPW